MYEYWAKTNYFRKNEPTDYHLLPYHCLDVAASMKVFLEDNTFLLNKITCLLQSDQKTIKKLLVFLASLHDVGKYNDAFQNKSEDALSLISPTRDISSKSEKVHHSDAVYALWEKGYMGVREVLSEGDNQKKYLLDEIFAAIAGHHGRPPGAFYSSNWREQSAGKTGQFTDSNKNDAHDFCHEAFDLFNPDFNIDKSVYDNIKYSTWIIAGVVVIADWIGSNKEFDFYREKMPLEKYYKNIALPTARDIYNKTGLKTKEFQGEPGFDTLFPDYSPRPLQKWADEIDLNDGPHLFIIENSTGSGKTEAALTLADKIIKQGDAKGFYMALPTQTSSNSMFDRITNVCKRLYPEDDPGSVVLAHGASRYSNQFQKIRNDNQWITNDNDHIECTEWIADSRKRALLSQIGVGTIDQALISMLPKTHQSLRIAGLMRNILIVDEIHAYEEYQQILLKKLLHLAGKCGMSVILLSATIPNSIKTHLVEGFENGLKGSVHYKPKNEYPLATYISSEGTECQESIDPPDSQNVSLTSSCDKEEVINYLIEAHEEGKCVCWFKNTVSTARDIYRELKAFIPDDKLHLAHGRFIRSHRTENDEKFLSMVGKESNVNDREGQIIIATQVFEQSLDIDFDFLISDLAPVDVLIQRFGRLCRHNRDPVTCELDKNADDIRPYEAVIYGPEFDPDPNPSWETHVLEKTRYVYPHIERLWATSKLIQEGQWTIPTENRKLIEKVYGKIDYPESLKNRAEGADLDDKKKRLKGGDNAISVQSGYGKSQRKKGWRENVPTRLGYDTQTLRVAVWKNHEIVPLHEIYSDNNNNSWAKSQIQIATSKICEPCYKNEKIKKAVKEIEENILKKAKNWTKILVLDEDLTGTVKNDEGKIRFVCYDRIKGLIIQKPNT